MARLLTVEKSYQGWGHCGWTDVVQGSRAGGIRETPPTGCRDPFVSFAAWAEGESKRTAVGEFTNRGLWTGLWTAALTR